jgi:uncharacterized iron-regulated membrane protein
MFPMCDVCHLSSQLSHQFAKAGGRFTVEGCITVKGLWLLAAVCTTLTWFYVTIQWVVLVAGGFYPGLPEDGSTVNPNKLQDKSTCSLKKKGHLVYFDNQSTPNYNHDIEESFQLWSPSRKASLCVTRQEKLACSTDHKWRPVDNINLNIAIFKGGSIGYF